MSTSSRKDLGALGEQLAAEHMARLGYEVVERNYRTRWGELDIVAFAGSTLAFCEVKTRRLAPGGPAHPFDSIRPAKRSQVRRMAASWLAEPRERRYAETIRFDAIGVTFDLHDRLVAIEHLEAAF